MKKFFIILGGIIGLFIILIVGYVIGNRLGQQTGAQQYTKKMFINNEMQISTNNVFGKINDIRAQNKLPIFTLTDGLCKVANLRAKAVYEKASGAWDQTTQQYSKEQQNAPESYDAVLSMVGKECPECDIKTYGDTQYVVLRPDPCWNFAGKQVCDGSEGFGMVEKYTDRVVNGWLNDSAVKQAILSNVKHGCVGAFGGAVVLSLSN